MDKDLQKLLALGTHVLHCKATKKTPEHWGETERVIRAPGYYPGSLSQILSAAREVSVDVSLTSIVHMRRQAVSSIVADLCNVQERLSVALARAVPRVPELIVWESSMVKPLLRLRFLRIEDHLWSISVHHYLREFICDDQSSTFREEFVAAVEASVTNVEAGRRYCSEGRHFCAASSAIVYAPECVVCKKHYDPIKHREAKV